MRNVEAACWYRTLLESGNWLATFWTVENNVCFSPVNVDLLVGFRNYLPQKVQDMDDAMARTKLRCVCNILAILMGCYPLRLPRDDTVFHGFLFPLEESRPR